MVLVFWESLFLLDVANINNSDVPCSGILRV